MDAEGAPNIIEEHGLSERELLDLEMLEEFLPHLRVLRGVVKPVAPLQEPTTWVLPDDIGSAAEKQNNSSRQPVTDEEILRAAAREDEARVIPAPRYRYVLPK